MAHSSSQSFNVLSYCFYHTSERKARDRLERKARGRSERKEAKGRDYLPQSRKLKAKNEKRNEKL